MNKASVIICTYNRVSLLRESISSIQAQDFTADQFEILVVDNNSTDGTADVVREMAETSPVKIKYIFEKQQGLSHARNTGINNSEGEIIVFTDDDVEAEKSWLHELVAAFEAPEVAAAGGPLRPIWLGGRPEWLTDNWQGYFAVSEFPEARATGEFKHPDYPWGANMAFRRSVLKKTDLFSPDLGRIGSCLLSNEELRLFRSIEERGHRIVFAQDAVIHHKISPERVRKLWLYHRIYWQGRSEAILDQQSGNYIYARLRTFSSGMLWRKLLSDKTDFEKECLDRITTGYLYQLLQANGNGHADFKHLRVLATFLGGLTNTAVNNIDERNDQIRQRNERLKECDAKIEEMLGIAAQKNEMLKQKDEMIALKSDQLAQKDILISQKNEQLARDRETILEHEKRVKDSRETILELEKRVKAHEEELRRRDQRIADLLNSLSWKVTSPLRAVYGIFKKDK